MALTPSDVIARCALRVGAYSGIPSTIETAYSTTPVASILSESITPSSIRSDLLFIEQEIAAIVAGNENQSWRRLIHDVTASIASGGLIPSTGSSGVKIIGALGQVRDADTGKALLRDLTIEDIQAINDNPNSMFSLGTYAAAIRPPRLYHTRTNATIDVCVFDYVARKTAIDADGELLFPAPNMYFFGVMTLLGNMDANLVELSKLYAPQYEAWRQAISAGRNEVAEAGD